MVIGLALVGLTTAGCGTMTGSAVGAGAGAIYDITNHSK